MISCNIKILKDKELESYNIFEKLDNNTLEKGKLQCIKLQQRINMIKSESVDNYFNDISHSLNK